VNRESGDNVTNLKLQKLLYYAQGFHIAMQGEPLFPESILAWEHGPVVRRIYDEYKHRGWQAIGRPAKFDFNAYPPEAREILNAVQDVYGRFTAKTRESMTHEEPPWKNTKLNRIISLDALRDFFSTLTDAGRKGRPVFGQPLWPTNSFVFQRRRAISERMEPHREKLRAIARHIDDGPDPWARDDD
jgi:uncharacterized phage-associated protein